MGYRPQAVDTSRAAERVQFDIYRGMTAAEKIEHVRALCRHANDLTLAGLRSRRPEETERQLRWRLAALRLGDGLARELAARSRG
jgi:hypothetical protein